MCFSEFFFIAADSDHAKTKLLSLLTVFGDFVTNPDPFREKDEKKYCFHRRQKFVKDACNSVCCNPLKQGSHYANRVLHARTVDLCSWSCGAGPQMLVAWSQWSPSRRKEQVDELRLSWGQFLTCYAFFVELCPC